jgi:hypothetical protein
MVEGEQQNEIKNRVRIKNQSGNTKEKPNESLICKKLIYTLEDLKWHACHFILSKWQSFTDLYEALRADSNLQWSNSTAFSVYSLMRLFAFLSIFTKTSLF